jgi:hypothetical protein
MKPTGQKAIAGGKRLADPVHAAARHTPRDSHTHASKAGKISDAVDGAQIAHALG